MMQIRFLSDYADVFIFVSDNAVCLVESFQTMLTSFRFGFVESYIFINRRADKPFGENAISTSSCLLACFYICLGNQHLPYGGEREGADGQIIIVVLMLLLTLAPT